MDRGSSLKHCPGPSLMMLGCLGLLATCGSSGSERRDATPDTTPPGAKDAPAVAGDTADPGRLDGPAVFRDAPAVTVDGIAPSGDAPLAGQDGPSLDGPSLDGPSVDAPPVDRPGLDGKTPVDGQLVTLPDGRVLRVVDYCEPIRPLPATSTDCPATFDGAMAEAATRQDASIPYYSARIRACSEGPYMYAPYGWGTACYYDPTTKQLAAIIVADDTLYPCAQSDTASFVRSVYGQWLKCTGGHVIPSGVDAGGALAAGLVPVLVGDAVRGAPCRRPPST